MLLRTLTLLPGQLPQAATQRPSCSLVANAVPLLGEGDNLLPSSPSTHTAPATMSSKKPLASAPLDISITSPQVQIFPSGYTESPSSSGSQDDTHDRNLVEHMARFRESPLDFLREMSLHVSGTGWRSYDNIIGQPIFYQGYTENMRTAVMSSDILRKKITELADKRIALEQRDGILNPDDPMFEARRAHRKSEMETSISQVAEGMVQEMICKLESKTFIRGAYYAVTALLTRAYHQGIHVSSEEVLRLRAVAETAAKNKQSIIFLPCHRSHIDYVSLQLICYRLGLALPVVVAGDNLNFPLVGSFLNNAGAMWIRRSFGDDQLYITSVQAYIDTLLKKGHNFECFIEGGRSRIGKLLPPKFGILNFLLDSVVSGRVNDAIVCPVSTQYDKVIEVDSYISELLGTPKKKESLSDFLSASNVLSLQLGRVDVRFHEPWSLKGFVQSQQTRFDHLTSSQQAELQKSYNQNLRQRLLRTLGYKVLSDINAVSVVMPTSLIGTVLLTLRGRGVGRSELIRRVEWLSERVRAQGGRVAHFAGLPSSSVVDRTLEVLGPQLVGVQKGLVEDTYYAVDRFQLSFYRNMTIHLFVSEAIVSAAMYSTVKAGTPTSSNAITYSALLAQVSFLSSLFRGEFIFPTQGLVSNLAATLQGLETQDIISITRARGPEGDITHVALSDSERTSGRENFDFYCFLIWPFVEASWLGAVSLLMLTPPIHVAAGGQAATIWLDDKTVQANTQLLGKTLFAQGDLSYFEAVNKEVLKNAYQRFEEEGIILIRKPAKGGRGHPQLVRLSQDWMPSRDAKSGRLIPSGKLWEFTEEISKSRLEGKNRRDGESVVGRLLRLIETISEPVWKTSIDLEDEGEGRRRRGREIMGERANL